MMTKIILRPYQQDLQDRVLHSWKNGAKNVLVVLPTGGGKSVIISKTIENHIGSSMVIAHRQELVSQMSLHLARVGVRHKIIAPKNVIRVIQALHRLEFGGQCFVDHNAPATVAAVDTLLARRDRLKNLIFQTTLWVVDEAHHLIADNKWGTVCQLFHNARGLGVTATPQRTDGKGLGRHADGLIDVMHIGPSPVDLRVMGSLAPYELVIAKSDFDVDRLKLSATGDYTTKSMKDEAKRSRITGDVVKSYLKFAKGKQGVTFVTDVETSVEVAEKFNAAGVPAASISGNTPDDVRARLIAKFKSGLLKQLVNVDILGEGVDVPGIEVVQLARPTQSVVVYLQQIGRVLRPGKPFGLIIDHVGNWKVHGLPDAPRNWTLDRRQKRASKGGGLPANLQLTVCTSCFHPYERFKTKCPHCGNQPVPKKRTLPEHVDGDLYHLDRSALDNLRRAAQLQSPASVGQKAAYVAGPVAGRAAQKRQQERIAAQTALREEIERFAAEKVGGGMSYREISKLYTLLFGIDVLTSLTKPAKEMEQLRERIIRSTSAGGMETSQPVSVA